MLPPFVEEAEAAVAAAAAADAKASATAACSTLPAATSLDLHLT